MQSIVQVGAFTKALADQLNQNFSQALGITTGNIVYLDPFGGLDSNSGEAPTAAVTTLATAYDKLREGKNDVVALISNGLTTSTARLSSGFTWSKNAAHIVGVSSGVNISNRSRIAPTAAATAFANFFTVSGSGCRFQNVQWFHGFDTGTTSAIAMAVTGGRNMFANCHIAGMGDTASAQSAGSRSLKISGTGENMFVDTTIGLDTISSNTSNAAIEFAGGAPRNQFIGCLLPRMTSSATTVFIVVSAAAGSDRFQYFRDCSFINAIKSTSTAMTGAALLAASMGGMLVFKDCTIVGCTKVGADATSLAQIYVDGAAPTAATSGLAVNPS